MKHFGIQTDFLDEGWPKAFTTFENDSRISGCNVLHSDENILLNMSIGYYYFIIHSSTPCIYLNYLTEGTPQTDITENKFNTNVKNK